MLRSALVGTRSEATTTAIDARWLMAYAAGIGETDSRYFDTTRSGGIVAHPLFPVCVEWVTGQASRVPEGSGLSVDELRRGVHLAHHLSLHQPVHAGLDVVTTATVVGVSRHRAGAVLETRIQAVGADDAPVWTTTMTSLLRGVDVDGDDRSDGVLLTAPAELGAPVVVVPLEVAARAAHVYSECSRIWNPIHTDPAVARAAGLPDVILHGTATLALAVSRVMEAAGVGPEEVHAISGRFGAMVPMPTTLTVRVFEPIGSATPFEVWTADGRPAVRGGVVQWRRGAALAASRRGAAWP